MSILITRKLNSLFYFKNRFSTNNAGTLNVKDEYNKVRKLTVRLLFVFSFSLYLIIIHGYYKANFPVMMYITFVSIIILIVARLLKRNMEVSNIQSAILFVYMPIVNIFMKDAFFLFIGNPNIKIIFLHTHFMLLIFICFGGLVCCHRQTLIVGGISVVWIWIFTIYLNDPFIWSLIFLDSIFFIGISFIMYFIYTSIHIVIFEFDKLGQTVASQNEELNNLIDFKDWMLNLIMHDLKTPVNRILSAGRKKVIPQKEILEPGKQILLMVENILSIYKLEESKMVLKLSILSIDDIIQKATKQVNFLLDEKTITINKRITVKSVIEVDEDLMERVIINLLNNAIKYSKANGRIDIQVLLKNDRVRVEVIDSGEGINTGDIHRIFEKHFQDNAKDLGYTHSSGLGLTFCKLVVEAHRGTIGAESVLGKGTTLWFELPQKSGNAILCEEITETAPKRFTKSQTAEKIILKYKIKIAHLAVYQIGEMLSILNAPLAPDSPDFLFWKDEIIKASMTGNAEYFDQLKEIHSD